MARPANKNKTPTVLIGVTVPKEWDYLVHSQVKRENEKGNMISKADVWREILAEHFNKKSSK